MKRLTGLVVMSLLVLGCSAAFGQGGVVLGFLSSDGTTQYCDYEAFLNSPPPYAAGIHVLRVCDDPYDGTLIGFKGNIPASTKLPVTGGELYLMADSAIDADCDCYTGDQAMLVSRVNAASRTPKFGWEYFVNTYDAFNEYLVNWGYLTNNIPTLGTVATGPTGRPERSFQNGTRDNNLMKK